jgi:hypothetical protein
MALDYRDVIDACTLIGLVSFPVYSVYWVIYHLREERRRRLWVAAAAFLAWCAVTWFCFLRLMLGCIGGHCDDTGFVPFAILYAISSAVLILGMHQYRAAP